MFKFTKQITLVILFLMIAYPAHDFIRNFTHNRIARVQDTNYHFSRYLRS